jgi:hypothetical protein
MVPENVDDGGVLTQRWGHGELSLGIKLAKPLTCCREVINDMTTR